MSLARLQRLREIRNAALLDEQCPPCMVKHPGCQGPEGLLRCKACETAHREALLERLADAHNGRESR